MMVSRFDELTVAGNRWFESTSLQGRVMQTISSSPREGTQDGCDSRAIVDETGCWGARFSQLVADGIVAEKLPAEMPSGQQRPAEGMAAR
jgi:hypothetical protein